MTFLRRRGLINLGVVNVLLHCHLTNHPNLTNMEVIRNTFLTCTFLCCALLSSAQIELDHTFSTTSEFDARVEQFVLEDGDEIYIRRIFLEDVIVPPYSVLTEFTIFDHNYSQLSQFQVVSGVFLNSQYASQHLFNLDDQIEFIINSDEGFRVVNIYGDILWDVGCEVSPVIINTTNGTKLIANCNEGEEVRVYTLPGSLPSGMAENTNPELLAYPNPSKSFINIPTEGVSQIEVFNTMGQKVFEVPTNGSQYQQIPTTQLAPGTYIYQTTSDQEVKPGKMFIVE